MIYYDSGGGGLQPIYVLDILKKELFNEICNACEHKKPCLLTQLWSFYFQNELIGSFLYFFIKKPFFKSLLQKSLLLVFSYG